MNAMGDWLYLVIGIAVLAVVLVAGLLTVGRRRRPPTPSVEAPPSVEPSVEPVETTAPLPVEPVETTAPPSAEPVETTAPPRAPPPA
jgi:fused signal recognition particle receptor